MIVGIAVPTTLESRAARLSAVRMDAVIASCSRVIGGSASGSVAVGRPVRAMARGDAVSVVRMDAGMKARVYGAPECSCVRTYC